MKILGSLILICVLFGSCVNLRTSKAKNQAGSYYLVDSIDSINSWYTIYASKKDSIYKIVVKKDSKKHKCRNIIKKGLSYKLELYSRKNAGFKVNGIVVRPMDYLTVQCYVYDEKTEICIEPQKGIYDLYHTPNLRGLCYIGQ